MGFRDFCPNSQFLMRFSFISDKIALVLVLVVAVVVVVAAAAAAAAAVVVVVVVVVVVAVVVVVRGATTLSKLGVQFLGLGYCTEKIRIVYPVSCTAVCYVTVITLFVKKVGMVRPNFGGSGPPLPLSSCALGSSSSSSSSSSN